MIKLRYGILGMVTFFVTSLLLYIFIFSNFTYPSVDVIALNRLSKEVANHWGHISTGNYANTPYDFVVLDIAGNVLYETNTSLQLSYSRALKQHDALLDIVVDDVIVGKLIVPNHFSTQLSDMHTKLVKSTLFFIAFLCLCGVLYFIYLYGTIILPFNHLKHFARQVACGNLDYPLKMDKQNLFGAFTESFDLMRHQLEISRQKEYAANQSKKELVATLSHDIKTPIASIKVVTELLLATQHDAHLISKLSTIYDKAEQVNLLVTDLFHTTLEDLGELHVTPTLTYSTTFVDIIREADYYHRIHTLSIPECMVSVDVFRLTQIIGNVLSNSYKYGGLRIDVTGTLTPHYLELHFKDNGSGVDDDDLPLLLGKFYRGKNAQTNNGSGLGLYISKQLLGAMAGDLMCSNVYDGFVVTLLLKLA